MSISDAEALRILEGMDWNDREEDALALAQELATEEPPVEVPNSAAAEEDGQWQYEESDPDLVSEAYLDLGDRSETVGAAVGRSGDATVAISRELLERWISDTAVNTSEVDNGDSLSK